ncbi:MAG TPA: hypothetical protein VM869_00790 [Enhygromyxa sp.]|nr:hypothetical protein [Enhygromyxa sp.]
MPRARNVPPLLRCVAALLLACACAPATPGGSDGAVSVSETADSSDDDTSERGSDTTGPALDLADHGGLGCEKVDLLFVIDNSVSMVSEHGNLIASFPEFIAGIQSTLGGTDSYHVGVITTDAYQFNDPECRLLGALVTQTGGASSSESECGPFLEGRYMTEDDELELGFACIGQVGLGGANDERPMQALELALAEPLQTGCNAGFLRDDALLVVVIITDEEDDHTTLQGKLQGSPGNPEDWFAALAARKSVESNVVVLTLIGGLPENTCPFPTGSGAEDSPRLRAFTEMFTHGFLGDVCAWSYGPAFAQAVTVIESACEGFTLP